MGIGCHVPVHGRLVAFITSLDSKVQWGARLLELERIRGFAEIYTGTGQPPGVEPRVVNDISQPRNSLINSLILGDEKRFTCKLFYDVFFSEEANHMVRMPLLHNSIEAHVLSAAVYRAANSSVG